MDLRDGLWNRGWTKGILEDSRPEVSCPLDPLPHSADDLIVSFRARIIGPAERALRSAIVVALLSFAHACAAHGGDCADRAMPGGQDRCAAAHHDGCTDPDGCGDRPGGDCSHASMCCSTWAPPQSPPTVPDAPAIVAVFPMVLPPIGPSTVSAIGLVPIPSESPPPLVSILRL